MISSLLTIRLSLVLFSSSSLNKPLHPSLSGVGKTCLVCRLTNPNAVLNTDVPATMGIEFDTQLINTSVGTVKAQIWDTAGQERWVMVP